MNLIVERDSLREDDVYLGKDIAMGICVPWETMCRVREVKEDKGFQRKKLKGLYHCFEIIVIGYKDQ